MLSNGRKRSSNHSGSSSRASDATNSNVRRRALSQLAQSEPLAEPALFTWLQSSVAFVHAWKSHSKSLIDTHYDGVAFRQQLEIEIAG